MRFRKFTWRDKVKGQDFDKQLYEHKALKYSKLPIEQLTEKTETDGLSNLHKPPFEYFYQQIEALIHKNSSVLEIGAGMGRHSGVILKTGALLTANDISSKSLEVFKKTHPNVNSLICGDMSNLPVESKSFDAIVSCGSLSYADPELMNMEIFRLLKDRGILIVCDSLNHNLIYRVNRFIHYILGKRSLNSIVRIPDLNRIKSLSQQFDQTSLKFFGSYLWIVTLSKFFIGDKISNKLNSWLEVNFPSGKNGFKFVLVCQGFNSSLIRKIK
jgi:ubiquinone/menaquinone biosynthesis C-methylase UbiE